MKIKLPLPSNEPVPTCGQVESAAATFVEPSTRYVPLGVPPLPVIVKLAPDTWIFEIFGPDGVAEVNANRISVALFVMLNAPPPRLFVKLAVLRTKADELKFVMPVAV